MAFCWSSSARSLETMKSLTSVDARDHSAITISRKIVVLYIPLVLLIGKHFYHSVLRCLISLQPLNWAYCHCFVSNPRFRVGSASGVGLLQANDSLCLGLQVPHAFCFLNFVNKIWVIYLKKVPLETSFEYAFWWHSFGGIKHISLTKLMVSKGVRDL